MKQPDLDFDHAHARRADPETSKAAAASISSESLSALRALVIDTLRIHGPMNDHDLVQRLCSSTNYTPSGVRTRRSELVLKGLVEDSGRRVTLPSGRQAIVWRATT